MSCPKCRIGRLGHIPLQTKDAKGGLEVEQCNVCGGIWFDPGELDRYLNAGAQVLDSPELNVQLSGELDQREAKCPRCSVLLFKMKAPQDDRITGDHCSKCGGLWLDAREADGIKLAEKVNVVFDRWLAGLAKKRGAAHD